MIAEQKVAGFSARSDRATSPASSRIQGKHSHLAPRERLRALARIHQPSRLGTTATEPQPIPSDTPRELADDLLRGADQIAGFIFGEPTHGNRRKVYYLAESSRLPVFRLGSMLCARRSVLLNWIAGQERRGFPAGD